MDISVVIPTLNETGRIAKVIGHTRQLGACEIIVVDGGSSDGTLDRADAADQCLTGVRGRATQQNTGAACARGDVLLFLHADCWIERGGFESIRRVLAEPRCVGGCFRQTIDATGLRFRLLEIGNTLRVRVCRLAYGDQGIFVRRDVFDRIGGFPEIRLMEDLFLMKRLRREGRVVLLEPRIHISARRWERCGVTRQTLLNWSLITLAQCGVSPNRLSQFYHHVR